MVDVQHRLKREDLMDKKGILQRITFGEIIAEEEKNSLSQYFVETNEWSQLSEGRADIVYGPKGSGKSALYLALLMRRDKFYTRYRIVVETAENPTGSTAFQGMVADPPTSERGFVALWKLYFLVLVVERLCARFKKNKKLIDLRKALQDSKLVAQDKSIGTFFRNAFEYVRRAKLASAEAGVDIDPNTGLVKGFRGKITFADPSVDASSKGFISVDTIFKDLNDILRRVDARFWILLDRLDVAFADTPTLEQNAIRALFRAYRDLQAHDRISLKIFLRDDIWRRITKAGFREASHITRKLTIVWTPQLLLNLIVRRIMQNAFLMHHFVIDVEKTLAHFDDQRRVFYRLFPPQIDIGPRKPETLQWILGRVRDGFKKVAPRELVHLLNKAKEDQIKRIEIGNHSLPNDQLFESAAIKNALEEVSRFHFEQTLLAEHPELRNSLLLLQNQKSDQSIDTLARIWSVSPPEGRKLADELSEIGFFERRGPPPRYRYWIPFLYRPALGVTQGKAS
jgi:hypothetical protein